MEGRKMLVLSSRLNRILKIQNVRYFVTMRYFLLKCNVLLKVSVVNTHPVILGEKIVCSHVSLRLYQSLRVLKHCCRVLPMLSLNFNYLELAYLSLPSLRRFNPILFMS